MHHPSESLLAIVFVVYAFTLGIAIALAFPKYFSSKPQKRRRNNRK